MQLRRARRLSSASTTYHGASGMSVCTNISSLAFENSTHRCRDSMSMGESFQRRIGSLLRERNRRSCSSSLTENQYFSKMMPSSTSMRSNSGHWCRKRRYSSGVQKPITCSTPARVYQRPVEQHDVPGRRQVLDVALEVPLRPLALGRRGERGDAARRAG